MVVCFHHLLIRSILPLIMKMMIYLALLTHHRHSVGTSDFVTIYSSKSMVPLWVPASHHNMPTWLSRVKTASGGVCREPLQLWFHQKQMLGIIPGEILSPAVPEQRATLGLAEADAKCYYMFVAVPRNCHHCSQAPILVVCLWPCQVWQKGRRWDFPYKNIRT